MPHSSIPPRPLSTKWLLQYFSQAREHRFFTALCATCCTHSLVHTSRWYQRLLTARRDRERAREQGGPFKWRGPAVDGGKVKVYSWYQYALLSPLLSPCYSLAGAGLTYSVRLAAWKNLMTGVLHFYARPCATRELLVGPAPLRHTRLTMSPAL